MIETLFIPSLKARDTEPPEVIIFFNVTVLPPTYVTCQASGNSVNVSTLKREVSVEELYIPQGVGSTSPVTEVTVTMRTRQEGDYQCSVSVFTTTENNLVYGQTTPVSISGWASV